MALDRQGYHKDDSQVKVVAYLDQLYKVLSSTANDSGSLLERLTKTFRGKKNYKAIKGCYLWGDVGQGKTWLVDLFFDEVPVKSKLRFHFHEFMQQIHSALSEFKQQKDPLKSVAKSLVKKAQLFCLDEFHISDIADAMLLHGLLDEMYRQGAVFVITSNVMPDELYKNGLQRSRFLPAIELITNNNSILRLDGGTDYRVQKQFESCNYYCPLETDTDQLLEERFTSLAIGEIEWESTINIVNRIIHTRAKAKNIVWFDFDIVCGGPRAAIDYITLAKLYEVVVISNVFKMNESHDDMARRFINLIDAFYDRKVGLIVSATGLPTVLYSGSQFKFEFARTVSRLEDMRSKPVVQATKHTGDFDKLRLSP